VSRDNRQTLKHDVAGHHTGRSRRYAVLFHT
jgi:hypothetical protein